MDTMHKTMTAMTPKHSHNKKTIDGSIHDEELYLRKLIK